MTTPRAVFSVSLLLALAACSRPDAPALPDDSKLAKLTEQVYVLRGADACAAAAGFAVTGKGVVVVDPGADENVGKRLVARIGAVTPEPVVAVFNTHRHAEQWRGNRTLKAKWPQAVIYAHGRTIAAAKKEGETGNSVVPAEIPVEDGDTLKVGALHFRVLGLAPAHTDSDIAIEVMEAGVVFTGDAVFSGCLDPMDDASFAGGVGAAKKLLQLDARFFVPGHGAHGGRDAVRAWHDYLAAVSTHVGTLRDQGKTENELRPLVLERLAPWRTWKDFDVQAPRHIARAFHEAGAF